MAWLRSRKNAYDDQGGSGECMIRSAKNSIWVFLVAILAADVVCADDISDARAVGITILRKLEQRKNAEVWQSDVSEWFKEKMTRAAFLANMTMIQAQLGGPSLDRELVQQNQADGNAQHNYKGQIFSYTFATTFPAAKAYETIVLIREGGAFKLAGFNYVPNPN
jgi:hypothetical protein